MAEHKIQGGDYLLKINDDTVVCLTSVGISDNVTVVDAASACGPDKSPGALEISISFEGQHLQDPDNGKISGTNLRQLLRSESTISFEITPLNPRIGDEIQSGSGFISELSSTYAFDSVGTFTGTIQCYGMPTTSIFEVNLGQFLAGGYVCYIEENNNYCLVAKDVETSEQWTTSQTQTNATVASILGGIINTETIVNDFPTGGAAAYTITQLGPGWFMPTVNDVLFGIAQNWQFMPFIGNDYNASIWTSCEFNGDFNDAFAFDFNIDNGVEISIAPQLYSKLFTHRLVAYKKINL